MNDPLTPQAHDEAVAKTRFFIMSGTRLLGAILVLLGILTVIGTLDWPIIVGYVLLIIGLIDSFILPQVLAKKWSSRNQ